MATLQKDFTTVQQIVENFPNKSSKFCSIMSSFLSKSKDDVEQIARSFKTMDDAYGESVSFLGENSKEMGPEEFFGTLFRFNEAVEDAIKQNAQALIEADKAKRREESKAKRAAEMEGKKKGEAAIQDSVVEELFGALKGGNVFKNRRVQQNQPSPKEEQKIQIPALRSSSGTKK